MIPKIYISGKISGLPTEEAKANFIRAEEEFLHEPVKTINPFRIEPLWDIKRWLFYMWNDIRELLKCDAIYMIHNWEDSRGARIEYTIAKVFNLEIYFEDGNKIE